MEGLTVNNQEATQAEAIVSVENLIKRHSDSIESLKFELKKIREMYKDSFNNDPGFREADEKAKEVVKAKNFIKKQIVSQPSVAQLAQKIKDITFDLKEAKKTLSYLLLDYKQQTGATQLELFSGQIMEIVEEARLVRAK